MKIGILTVSDRASRGEYTDMSGPAIANYLERAVATPWERVSRVVPDGADSVAEAMVDFCDRDRVALLLVTGGTGPAARDQTPEAMNRIIDKELPGFGEIMRRISFETVPTAILSRQGAGIRGATLIITLPGKPAAIDVCLGAIFPAVPYCLELIGAGLLETTPAIVQTFRPGG